jgi:Uma2 family endonuclease
MPDDDSVRVELDEGEVIRIPPASGDHGYCGSEILSVLRNYVKKHHLGRVYNADTGFQLSAGRGPCA